MEETTIPNNEIIQVADIVAREKSIDREIVFFAMEEAIQKAGKSRYGNDRDIRAHIDRKNGAISLQRWTLVVDEVEDDDNNDDPHTTRGSAECQQSAACSAYTRTTVDWRTSSHRHRLSSTQHNSANPPIAALPTNPNRPQHVAATRRSG